MSEIDAELDRETRDLLWFGAPHTPDWDEPADEEPEDAAGGDGND